MKCLVLVGIFAVAGLGYCQVKQDSTSTFKLQLPPPAPTPSKWQLADGRIKYGLDAVNNNGVRTYVEGRQQLFNNGRTKVEAYGGADRVFGGPRNRETTYGGGGRFTHEWGKRK